MEENAGIKMGKNTETNQLDQRLFIHVDNCIGSLTGFTFNDNRTGN